MTSQLLYFFRPRRKSYQSCKSSAANTYRAAQRSKGSSFLQGWRRRLGVRKTVKRVNLGNSAKDAHFYLSKKSLFSTGRNFVDFLLTIVIDCVDLSVVTVYSGIQWNSDKGYNVIENLTSQQDSQ